MNSHDNRPRIGIALYGLPRASAITLPSILDNIITPAGTLGETVVRYHLFRQQQVVNTHSGESGALDEENYRLFSRFEGVLEEPEGIPERHGLAAVQAFGDAWGNNFQSTRNLLLQLHSLHNVTQQLLAQAPDLVVFARADLLYHDSMAADIAAALADRRSVARLPDWQWGGGYNDRFCICGREAIVPFGQRLDLVGRYLDRLQRPLHSERLLQFALDSSGIAVKPVSLRASRVRLGGKVRDEKFRRAALARRLRWRLREWLKALLVRA